MFKIGDRETKISVTTWKGTVKVHFRKFFQSSFDRRIFYPSKQGIALTLNEWEDLKKVISDVDQVIDCTQFMLEEKQDQQSRPFERQVGVNEEEDMSGLQSFNDGVVNEIVRLNTMEPEVKKVKLSPPENFDCNANFAIELQEEQSLQERNRLECTQVEQYENADANFAFEFQE